MKILILTSSLVLGCLSLSSQADYLINIPLTEKYGLAINQSWVAAAPLVSNWLNYNNPYNCTSWTPDASTIDEGVSFIQTEANCKQDQKRTVTSRETNKATGETRTINTVTETQTILGVTGSLTQTSIGTRSITGCYYSFGEGVIKSYVEHRMEKSPKTNKYKSFYYNDKFLVD